MKDKNLKKDIFFVFTFKTELKTFHIFIFTYTFEHS